MCPFETSACEGSFVLGAIAERSAVPEEVPVWAVRFKERKWALKLYIILNDV